MDFIFVQLWLKVFTVTNILWTVTGDMSVEVAFSLLNDRLDNLAVKVYSIENELKTNVASINQRIDTIEMTYNSVLKHNPIDTEDQVSSKRHDLSNKMHSSRREHNVVLALKDEKVFIRESLDAFGRKFAALQSYVNDNVNTMNETIEQYKVQSCEKLEKLVSEQNEFKNQMTNKSNKAAEEINAQVREALQNATIERELYFTTIESSISNVNNSAMSTSKWIKQELDEAIKKQVTSIIKDERVVLHIRLWFNPSNLQQDPASALWITNGSYRDGKFVIPKAGMYLIHLSTENEGNVFELNAGYKKISGEFQTHVLYLYSGQRVYFKLLRSRSSKWRIETMLHIILLT